MKRDPSVSLEGMIAKVKSHPNISKAGMILVTTGLSGIIPAWAEKKFGRSALQ